MKENWEQTEEQTRNDNEMVRNYERSCEVRGNGHGSYDSNEEWHGKKLSRDFVVSMMAIHKC